MCPYQQALQLVAQFSVMKTGFASHSPASFHSLHEQVSGVQRSGSGAHHPAMSEARK